MPKMIKMTPPNFLYKETTVRTQSQINSLMSRVAGGGFVMGGSRDRMYRAYTDRHDNLYVYTAQKVRRKVRRIPLARPKKTPMGLVRFRSEVLSQTRWEVRIFKFPKNRVISVVQKGNTFRAVIE